MATKVRSLNELHQVKNQYFGDKRDYFKWNLISDLTECQANNKSLTYLPMLTHNDSTNEGLFIVYPVAEGNKYIHDYLCDCLNRKYRNIKALRTMFSDLGIKYEHYWDNQYFAEDERNEYFASIPSSSLENTLIFIDPDVGIEPKSRSYMINNGIEKYLLWSDIEVILSKLRPNTTLLIYQHLQFNAHKITSDLNSKCEKLESICPEMSVDYIRDKDVAFLAVHKNNAVTSCLNKLASLHGLFTRVNDTSDSIRDVHPKNTHKYRKNITAAETDLIDNTEGLSVQDVVNRRVLCPACKEKVFSQWPLGWDSHAARCKGIDGINSTDRKKSFKSRYRHLFR